jgi:hypothetical protein
VCWLWALVLGLFLAFRQPINGNIIIDLGSGLTEIGQIYKNGRKRK